MEGGHLLSLGVALKRAFVNGSERPDCSIRGRGGIGGPFPVKLDCVDGVGSGHRVLSPAPGICRFIGVSLRSSGAPGEAWLI
jgi:hypothetical protein